MANIRLIKRRIKSAKNIAQITRAMELVAASKMKKAQLQALAGKLYAQKIYDMVTRLAPHVDAENHPLLQKSRLVTGKTIVILISTNKGLCGGLNTNLFRFFTHQYSRTGELRCITFGKKGASFLSRLAVPIIADFSDVIPFAVHVSALTDLVTKEYIMGHIDSVEIVTNEFISALKQIPTRKKLLPLVLTSPLVVQPTKNQYTGDILIEPNAREVFAALLPHYVENQIRDAILQAEASEQSARMVAMRNATDNALSLTDVLTLLYNKARQEKITYEITDMVTARLAVQ